MANESQQSVKRERTVLSQDPTSSPMHPASPSWLEESSEVDKVDVQLIALLTVDGRMSVRDLAREVGLTETTVTSRIRSLTGRRLMRVRAVIDWRVAGFAGPVAVFVRVRNRSVSSVLAELAFTPEVKSISRVYGSADLIIRTLVADMADMAQFIDRTIHPVQGAEVVSTLFEAETHKYLSTFSSVDPLDNALPHFPAPPIPLDELDMQILRSLIEDARQPWRQVAENLDCSESTARTRARRIESAGLFKVMAQIGPYAVRHSVGRAWIGVRTGGDADAVVEHVLDIPEFSIVARTVGSYDLLLFGTTVSDKQLTQLLDELRDQANVLETETWKIASMKVLPFPWGRSL